jgi:hypothetical protein
MTPRIVELNEENPEASLPVAELKFTKKASRPTVVDNEQVYIVLKDSKNKGENLLRIAEEYVNQGVMYGARRLVNEDIRKAVNVVLTYRLIKGVDPALRIWDERHYQPCLSNTSMKDALEKVAHMDQTGGYLTRIFIPELELVARRLGVTINPRITSESREWLDIVHNISLKHHEEPEVFSQDRGPLVLRLPNIAVGFVLIAKSWRIAMYDTKYHEGWAIRHLNDPKINEVFIIGWTEENCYHAIKVLGNTYLRSEISEVWPTLYRIRSRGEENVPLILVRYIKGEGRDDAHVKKVVRAFQKMARKKLKRMFVTREKVTKWFQKTGYQYIGTRRIPHSNECRVIATVMDEGGMTIEVLDHIFEDSMVETRFNEMVKEKGISHISVKDEVLYRIHVAMGFKDEEIIPRLDPMIFLNSEK